jgi:4'-phosphopantetheinyl transferase EntD
VLEQILPPAVEVVETDHDEPGTPLFPEEEAVIARAVPKRRREFTAGRACARRALARLGVPPAPLLPGERGAPSWPDGTTGSITHCPGYRAAAVARTRDVAALGVDAEPNGAVPDGVLGVIATDGERTRIGRLGAADARVSWDRLLFSAKESVYKAWFPLTRRWLGFDQADITIGALDGTFTARLLVPGPLVAGSALTVLHGRWVADQGLVATAVVIPAWPAGGRRAG